MIKKCIYIVMIIVLIGVIAVTIKNSSSSKTVQTSSGEVLSNKKIGWGIKRAENNEQPDLGTKNLALIKENEDIAMGNSKDKYVYLTFDNGYEAGYTAKILDTLKANDVNAAFFITGHYLNTRRRISKKND